MKIDDCYQLGYIVRTHGLKGELVLRLDVDHPEEYYEMESVLLEQSGQLVPFFISSLSARGSELLVCFEDITSKDNATELVGQQIYLPADQLPELTGEDQYYYHDLIGFDVLEDGQLLGKVESVHQPSSQWLAAVMVREKEVLIPLEEGIVQKVDKNSEEIHVVLPEGFLDVFL